MAITKILARKGGLTGAINYVMNGDKTEEQLLVATHLCTKENACRDMLRTKKQHKQTDGVQYYHIVQSFKPGEITPELEYPIPPTDKQVRDWNGTRWARCDKCNIWFPDSEMSYLGGPGEKLNRGACRWCVRNRTQQK